MKRNILNFAVCLFLSASLASCYKATHTVGKGAQGSTLVKKKNWYLLGGLAAIDVKDSKDLAGGASDYTVKTKFSLVDYFINSLTFGIVAPNTIEVTK